MTDEGALSRSRKRLRPAAYAALGGILFAAPVPFVLTSFWSAATLAFRAGPSDPGAAIVGALSIGLIAFGVGATYLLVVGFPVLLVMWLVRLRHPMFPAIAATLISFVTSGPHFQPLWLLVGVSTGVVAGIYARRCGLDALKRWGDDV